MQIMHPLMDEENKQMMVFLSDWRRYVGKVYL
jgi:hypothetical protein